ncbi:MAG: bifunctional UDP-N-acetylglucosamine pyrophosphorylase / glucosamine-phosphate N-acetyltransferase [Frankiaceae bacterium]|nr:bifunctional UDP-N-acetylglucosamine pyrophosphorylase / glucosamine-phosphate N-acetyltransferase [Frankiaceae bacterium]
MTDHRPALAVVLAAGQGTRMKSAKAKVLHEIAGRSLLGHVLASVAPLAAERTVVVVGHDRETVEATLPAGVTPAVQAEQKGTGHAVRLALESLDASGHEIDARATVVVLPGDAPLLRAETLHRLVTRHREQKAAATLLTAVMDDPTGYGRVVRSGAGSHATSPDALGGVVRAVVEQRDADEATRQIHEVAVSVYAFAAGSLRDALARLTTDNAQGEEYLTDVIGLLVGAGALVQAVTTDLPAETAGVNDRVQLAAAGKVLNARLVEQAMRDGVTVVDPDTTWLGAAVELAADVTLLPNTDLAGATRIRAGAVVGPDCSLTDTEVGEGAVVRRTTADSAVIGAGATVGPYTYLRPGTRLGARSKAGAFVEMKAANLGDGAKVPHLSYVGDADIGEGSNIGCATVFVNYDGQTKHRTVVGRHTRIGSDTMLVAPVQVGDGAYTAAGSVITDDVPPGAIGVGRARQRNIDGWVERRRPGTVSADAASATRTPSDQQRQQQQQQEAPR